MSQTSIQNVDLPAVNAKVARFGVVLIAAIVIACFSILIVNGRSQPTNASPASAAPTTPAAQR